MKEQSARCMRILTLLLLNLFLFSAQITRSAEFVIMNRVISWDVNSGDAFWTIPVDAAWPTNWLSPNDYYHGQIYTRYEVISVATEAPFRMQFGIFQWEPAGRKDSCGELCEPLAHLQGAGSVAINNSSPVTWWKSYGGVDFSRVVADFQSMSPIIYAASPEWPVSPAGSGGDDAGLAWAQRFNWFPVTLRVTVIGVSLGSTFSGWDNYIPNPALQKLTPTYGIDYINETTDKAVPSTDEYSNYPTMYGKVSGTGQKITVPPGQQLYFRTKAGNGLRASEIQVLRVPVRPATPAFVLDKVNHITTTAISNEYEYCDFSDMSGAITGNGTAVPIPAATTKYIQKKASASTFKSKIQTLNDATKLPIAHEFVIFNNYAEWPNNTDTNGFYYSYFNADMPLNWKSPENFYDGIIYIRYELISEKTTTPVGLQFGIWQMTPPETGELHETMSNIKTMNGPGSVVYSSGSLSSSADYWSLDGNLDYTRMNLTWHFGINPWKLDQVYGDHKQIRQENASVWAERNTYYFPMKAYVTVVAVSYGHSFSGWSNYLGVKPPTPSYTMNCVTEKTNQVIPSTDEYSYSTSMSPSYAGTGATLTLQPGQNVYFRTKAQGIHPASDIQRLIVSARPSISDFTIDFPGEKTSQNVASDIEYSVSAAFTSSSVGTGSPVTVNPGQDLYFRKSATSSSFVSETHHLISPARLAGPSISIDYASEKTNEVLSSAIEYSSNSSMTGATVCSNAKLDLNPGTDLYLRVKATGSSFASLITALDVPARPSTPVTDINYETEASSAIPSTQEWSENASMSSATQGANTSIPVTPGTDLYIRAKVTAASFASGVQHLVVPARPSVPSYTINYQEEKTNQAVSTVDDYATNIDMTGAAAGTNALIALTPGTDLYFRTQATASSFYSTVQHLTVAQRPETPVFTIDYSNIATNETAGTNIEYSPSAELSGSVAGTGNKVALNPGQDLYFRKKAGSNSFRSGISFLSVPERNFLGYSGNDTITTTKFSMYALLINGAPEFSLGDLQIANGTSGNLRAGNVFDVYPAAKGIVSVIIPANTITENSFASNEVVVYFNTGTGIPSYDMNNFSIHPNPSTDGIIYIQTNIEVPYTIDVISSEGKILRKIEMNAGKYQQLRLGDLQKGIYYLKMVADEGIGIQKLLLE